MTKNLLGFLKLMACCIAGIMPQAAQAQYCTTSLYSSACSSGDFINSFSTTGGSTNITNNNTGCNGISSPLNYIYYSSLTHTTAPGTTVNFSTATGSWGQTIVIYVDWNQNGLFTDAGEQMYSAYVTSTGASSNFVVPGSASVGMTRMRVRAFFSGTTSPCGSSTWGECEDYNFNVMSPCASVSNVASSNVFARSATVSWTAGAGSTGYEYVLKTTSGNPTGNGTAVTGNSVNLTNLTPATTYWLYVRNRCSASSTSVWSFTSFTTSNCIAPIVSFANITHQSATALWNSIPISQSYDYIYGTNPAPPTGSAGVITTTSNSFIMESLLEKTTYYVHIRSHCLGNETSGWDTYQFNTMQECMPPAGRLNVHSNTEMTITWDEVATAVAYEYAVNSQELPPSLGNTIYALEREVSIPDDKKAYYFHVRTKCVSIFNTSDWATIKLREAPVTAVSNVNKHYTEIKAYPNPVKDILMVDLENMEGEKGDLVIVDMSGKVVYSRNITAISSLNIDMSGFAKGLYLLKYNSLSQTIVEKIIKE